MGHPSDGCELDPVIVPILHELAGSMDNWLAGLRGRQPVVLPTSTVELLAEARAQDE